MKCLFSIFNPLSANPTKWSNTHNGQQPTNCLSLSNPFVELALKGLMEIPIISKIMHVWAQDLSKPFSKSAY